MFNGAAPSLLQIFDGSFSAARLCEVMAQQFRLRFDRLRKCLHQGISNPAVKLLSLAPHHRGIGRLLNQCMLEDVRRIRWFAAGKNQPAGGNVSQSRLQRVARGWDDRSERTIGEFATNRGANLCDLLACTEPVQTRSQRTQQRTWNIERPRRSNGDVSFICLLQLPRFQHCLGEFFGKQRNAVRLAQDLLVQFARQLLSPGDLVTFDSSSKCGKNSGLKLHKTKIRAVLIDDMLRASSSSVLESIQCASANLTTTGCTSARPIACRIKAAIVSSLCRSGVRVCAGTVSAVGIDSNAANNPISASVAAPARVSMVLNF